MPTETLRIRYTADVRSNRRRPKHPVIRAMAHLILWVVALFLFFALLMKLGMIQENPRSLHIAARSPFPPLAFLL